MANSSKIKRTYKYRLYPNVTQDKRLDLLFWQGRKVWNEAIAGREAYWDLYGKYPNMKALSRQRSEFCAMRKAPIDEREFEFNRIHLLPYNTVDDITRRLTKSYNQYFQRLAWFKQGKWPDMPGKPKFRNRYTFKSLGYKYGSGCKFIPTSDGWGKLYIANVGEIRIRYHRDLPEGAVIKMVIVKREATGKWFAYCQIEMPTALLSQCGPDAVGLDFGLMRLATLSDGTEIDNPRWLREAHRELRIAERRKSRRKKGSARRNKARVQVAKLHEKVANQRRDYYFKVVSEMVSKYSLIAVEDLNVQFMLKNKHLARSASDAGLMQFRDILLDKAKLAGVGVVMVNPAYTSQTCSDCGEIVQKSLKERIHRCVSCGLELDRDVNAARNILQIAVKGAGSAPRGVTQANRSNVLREAHKPMAVATVPVS